MLLLPVLVFEPELVRDPALPVLPRSSALLLISPIDPEELLEASCCVWKHWRGGPRRGGPSHCVLWVVLEHTGELEVKVWARGVDARQRSMQRKEAGACSCVGRMLRPLESSSGVS